MHRDSQQHSERPGHPHLPDTAGRTGPARVPAELIQGRQLEKTVSWTRGERLRCLWYRLRLTVAEMNYATRRMAELQAPWISADQSRRPRRTS
jgi:hypothetical protein